MKLRQYRDDDFDELQRLMEAAWEVTRGERFPPDELRTWLSSPKVNVESDVRLAERDGRLVGYADVDRQDNTWWSDIRVLPGEEAAEIVAPLVAWAEQRATDGRLRVWATSTDRALRGAYEQLGFRSVRHSYGMEIDLGPQQLPAWPLDIAVRTFAEGDGPRVHEAIKDVWRDTWDPWDESYEEWAHWSIGREDFDPSLWFLAHHDGELAGFSLCSASKSRVNTGWVDLLGVRRPWRGRGLGEALLRHSFGEFADRGFARAGLGVDAQSPTGATRLYERVGMSVFRETIFYDKEL
jgi:mycothiol synthase